MMIYVGEYIVKYVELLGLLLLIFKLREYKETKWPLLALRIIPVVLLHEVFSEVIDSKTIQTLLIFILYISFVKFYLKIDFASSFFSCLLGIIVFGVIQLIPYAVLLPTPLEADLVSFELIAIFIATGICFLIYLFVPIQNIAQVLNERNYVYRWILVNMAVVIFYFILLSKWKSEYFFSNIILIVSVAALLLLINIEMIRTHTQYKKQQQALDSYNQYLPIIEDLIDEVRSVQHNFDNVLQSISMLPVSYDNYKELAAALLKYSQEAMEQNYPYSFLKLNCKLVTGLLSGKLNTAGREGKILNIKIKNQTLETIMPEYELVQIIGILVDNELEAIEEGEEAQLILDQKGAQVQITTRNRGPQLTGEMINNMFSKGYTTKQQKEKGSHGWGLYKLKQMVNHYHGEVCMLNEEKDGNTNLVIQITV